MYQQQRDTTYIYTIAGHITRPVTIQPAFLTEGMLLTYLKYRL